MDFSFGAEEKALADSFRDFLRREVLPKEEELKGRMVETDGASEELRQEVLAMRRRSADLGFYGVDIPIELGGGGLSYVGQALLREVAGATGSFLALACLSGPEGPTNLLLGMKPALRERLVPPFLRAEISACFALTEPDAGSDNQSMKTRAVRDADEWVIGEVGMGFYNAMQFLTGGRANIAAMCVGFGDYLMRASAEYAKSRVQFGKPIGKMQGVAFQVADMAMEVEMARLLTYKLAWMADQGEALIQAAAYAKLFATEMVGRAADTAIQVHGGVGLTRELGLERIYRFVRILRIVEGTSEIQRYLIAKSLGL
jgi:alkylation response protein AidB-like acyl-CoA dehydrogenase